MFVSVDLDKLQFLHKHRDHETISALAFLEAPHRSVLIDNTDRPEFLCKMTSFDLRMLYRNTTATDITGTNDIVVRELLATLVEANLLETLAVRDEVEAQVAAVDDDLHKGIPWKYARGSKRPAKQEQLFNLHGAPLDPHTAAEAAQRAPQRRAARTPTARPAATVTAPAPPPAVKQRASSVRPTIWAVADRMWAEAGSPKDKAVVLELRKKMMAVLETENNVKRTSSSNELGNWMKDRVG